MLLQVISLSLEVLYNLVPEEVTESELFQVR